ncbi:MAG TPA: hypothetical protein VFU10_13035 [Gaiellaceae bacterium]|nr:hypothetical protein [Gaiellaceae bacterium]
MGACPRPPPLREAFLSFLGLGDNFWQDGLRPVVREHLSPDSFRLRAANDTGACLLTAAAIVIVGDVTLGHLLPRTSDRRNRRSPLI